MPAKNLYKMDQTQLNQLAHAVSELAGEVREIRSDFAQLRSEVASIRSGSQSQSFAEPRPVPVSQFSGDPHLGKGFIAQCEVTFNLQPSRFGSDCSRVGFIVSALSGRALDWYTAVASRSPIVCLSYDLFKEQFLTVFSLPEAEEDAAIRLNKVVQGNRSVSDYSVEFRVLAAQCNVTDDSMRGTFFAGLNQEIKDGLINQYPTNFTDLVRLAIRVDSRLTELGSRARRHGSPSFSLPVRSSPEPMEVGRSRVLSDQERKERLEKGLCLYCGVKGHWRHNCPKLAKDQTH